MTSFDWNEADPNIIGTSSIDTTCTIWDVEARSCMPRHPFRGCGCLRPPLPACSCTRVTGRMPYHRAPCWLLLFEQTQKVRTQLIAHDKEVYDMAFARGKDEFASVGADGSVRMFDLR